MSLAPGVISQVSVSDDEVQLLATAPTSGTTPYSYQWYRSQTTGFTPGVGNILTGKVALALTDDDVQPSTIYYYKIVQTDSAGTPAHVTPAQMAVVTLPPQNILPIETVLSVSVATPQTGIGSYNTSNVALFSVEPYDSGNFGDLGYKIYLSPTEVATDFGTDSNTYKMALALFSQQPNILANGGYLVVIPMIIETQLVSVASTPVAGAFHLNYGSDFVVVQYNDTAATVQTALRLIDGLEDVVVTGSITSGVGLSIQMKNVYAPSLFTVDTNTTSVAFTVTVSVADESLAEAINRTKGIIQYFGIMASLILPNQDVLDAAAVVQAVNKVALFVSNDPASVLPDGIIDLLRQGSFSHSRGLFYGVSAVTALQFMGAFAGRGFSTIFSGSLTTQNMNLKTLNTILPDSTMTPSLYTLCQTAGADIYASVQGVSKLLESGANGFFDQVYNLGWFVGAIQVAGFNVLAQTNTKIPQTESGMNQLKGALRVVCTQGVTNQYLAPGAWNSPTTFGNQADFLLNIAQYGYYIYSSPISQQLAADRAARNAPPIQIAIKEAGAINKGFVIINVNP